MEHEKPQPIEIPPEKQKELEEKKKRPYPVGTGGEFLETWEDYFTWFAKTLGSQAAQTRKMGLIHRNLQPQNITLDCSIVDFDTMMEPKQRLEYLKWQYAPPSEEDLYRNDYQKASGSLASLIDLSSRILEGLLELNTKTFLDIFEKSYQEVLAQ